MKAFERIKTIILDLDGTVYLDDQLIDGARDAILRMQASGKRVLYLTNNSSMSRAQYYDKLHKMQLPAQIEDIYSSASAATDWIRKQQQFRRVFLLGTGSMAQEFSDAGIAMTTEKPDLVVVTLDTEMTYHKLDAACHHIRNGIPYIATHANINCPTKRGAKPDVGSFLTLIEASTGIPPLLICGKPYPPMVEGILGLLGGNGSQAAMIGDSIPADMAFAVNAGMLSVLVLSGESKSEDVRKYGIPVDLIWNSIADFS